ncbi:hypothetical protein Tsubulata_001808 [Turnera subulata]|uniref:Uncharacterized protein n=1 Tax=Turnera subulata TaxID=218843 RepID=A0A9Q0G3E9_9ROSI|nr:hypothetical protein Tsubulata_001808 [Turnera subulata]
MHTTRNISEKIKSVIKKKCSHVVHGGCSSDYDPPPYELHAVIEGAKAPKKGCFVVCVGGEEEEEEKRYQIPLQYLSHPAFLQLLKQYQDDPDDKIDGPLKIPCTVEFFDRFLKFLKAGGGASTPACKPRTFSSYSSRRRTTFLPDSTIRPAMNWTLCVA